MDQKMLVIFSFSSDVKLCENKKKKKNSDTQYFNNTKFALFLQRAVFKISV